MSVLAEQNSFVSNIEMRVREHLALQHYLAPADPAEPAEVSAHAIQRIEEFKGTDAGAMLFLQKQCEVKGGQYLSAIQWTETVGHGRHEK